MNELKRTKEWFKAAIPNPTIEQACIQVGVHIEEFSEMLSVTGDTELYAEAEKLADYYKQCSEYHIADVKFIASSESHKIELIDSLVDQIVTAIGIAHMLGMDIEGALSEVNDSNYSKFEDGKPVFNEQGKISKGKHYKAPNLARFVK